MTQRFDIIDAFVDGETVDPVALKQALSEPEGRDHLVDAWLLRDLVQEEMASDAAPPARPAAPPRRAWLLAAMVAGVCLIGGYAIGARFPAILGTPAAPTPDSAVGSVAPAPAPAVPQPTRIIRLEFDPAQQEGSGGR